MATFRLEDKDKMFPCLLCPTCGQVNTPTDLLRRPDTLQVSCIKCHSDLSITYFISVKTGPRVSLKKVIEEKKAKEASFRKFIGKKDRSRKW